MASVMVVTVQVINDNGQNVSKFDSPVMLTIANQSESELNARIVKEGSSKPLMEFTVDKRTECARFGKKSYTIVLNSTTHLVNFQNEACAKDFHMAVTALRDGGWSVFSDRTDESSASQYFQFYGYLSQQQNMLQDFIRTSTYQKAIIGNFKDFQDKVVLDVGAGSGILSFFAAQAGAKRVYAVEASSMANHATSLVAANGLENVIKVIAEKVEELNLPEMVDVIVSEPMGYMLINERMLETYLHAKKFLKPNGKMFPCQGDLHVAPFQDEALYTEQFNKSSFWYQNAFHNVDLRCLKQAAQTEYFGQPIVDTFDIRICVAKSVKHTFDFRTADETDLHVIEIPLEYHILEGGSIHGLAFWFDVLFSGSSKNIWLSTHPTEPLTHWYQVRCLLETPLFVNVGDFVTGFVSLHANKRQSYDVTIQLQKTGSDGAAIVTRNTLDLKNPNFRYSGTATATPPGANTTSPSDVWWSSLDDHNLSNGLQVNGDNHGDLCSPLPQSVHSRHRTNSLASLTPTSTQQGQLIGGGISPTMFTSSPGSRQPVSHYPVNNSMMIGDYVASGVPIGVVGGGAHPARQ